MINGFRKSLATTFLFLQKRTAMAEYQMPRALDHEFILRGAIHPSLLEQSMLGRQHIPE